MPVALTFNIQNLTVEIKKERFDASGKGKGKEGRVDPQVISTQYLSTLSLTFSYNLHIKGKV